MTAATRWPDARATRAMIATPHALASEAGVAILQRGGNAVDAAIAAAATVAVVYPHMNGVGGDNFWLIFDGRTRTLRALNAAGRSAAAATLEIYQARFGAAIPPRGGAAALTVPGTVSGWWAAHLLSRDSLGSPLAWTTLLEEAIAHPDALERLPPGAARASASAQRRHAHGAFLKPEFCQGCHQFAPDGFALNGKLLENTYNEWRASRFKRRSSSGSCPRKARRSRSAQGKVLDPASKVGEVRGHGDQLQVVDALADRHLELMGVHQPGKGLARSLPLRGLRQKVRVPGELSSRAVKTSMERSRKQAARLEPCREG